MRVVVPAAAVVLLELAGRSSAFLSPFPLPVKRALVAAGNIPRCALFDALWHACG